MASKDAERREFGYIRKLKSGRYSATYADPYKTKVETRSGKERVVDHRAPFTFESRADAEEWLVDERRLMTSGTWRPPAVRDAERRAELLAKYPTFGEYAPRWLAARKVKGRPLADRTRDHYQDLLDRFILPTFEDLELREISPELVGHWYDTSTPNLPTTRAHAYSLLRSIMATAADPTKNSGRSLIPFNPCGITGGGSASSKRHLEPATAEQVAIMAAAMPDRHRLIVLLADGCALRFGELVELRRGDVDTKQAVIRVRRAAARSRSAGVVVKSTKSEAGARDVPIPPDILPAVRQHILEHAELGKDGRLFPGTHGATLAPSTFYGHAAKMDRDGEIVKPGYGWYEARRQAGREDVRLHDLRHGALTDAARHGATLAELMELGGHSTKEAALRYQQVATGRQAEIAERRARTRGWTPEDETEPTSKPAKKRAKK
ncbi:MAG: site-specific integrase [Nocardioidaceae bacterium]|mgnify:CR=1 FL=1|nr:site-specific integrase [Nocardioidaceae bacterium]